MIQLDATIKQPLPKINLKLLNFDFAVLRYIWSDSSGSDLDTRTAIVKPSRNVEVGWSRSQSDMTYLQWGSDNTGSGVECVLLNLNALKEDYPDTDDFQINLSAFWFSEKRSGTIIIEFESYVGGEMQRQGFDFVNIGGLSIQTLTLPVMVNLGNTTNHPGELVAALFYNSLQKTGMLIDA